MSNPEVKKHNKIAIMGGTFNPIHNGHLVAAEAVRQELDIDTVIFIPTGNPPHKESNPMYNEHRYLMTVLATVTNPQFEVSRIELDRSGKTYAIDTVREVKELYGKNCKLYYITGADAIAQILTWKSPEKLLSQCCFVAVTRPGYDKTSLQKTISNLEENFRGNIITLEIPALSISSTDIRNRVHSSKTIKYLVPESVEEYISKFNLYINDNSTPEIDSINRKLHTMLTPKRFKHTQGVAEEAVKLAKRYGADKKKAYIAGLLHDCAKCIPTEEKLEACKKYGIKPDPILKAQPDLTHSFLGAKIAEKDYGIKDNDILNSIAYHTTGRADMSLLEKIIYIADYIEPNRAYFEGLDYIRKLAYEDIDKTITAILKKTISYNKNKVIHPLSLEALDYYSREE